MQSERRWLPAASGPNGSSYVSSVVLRVSVATVQHWAGRYRQASEAEQSSGAGAEDLPCTPHRQPGWLSEGDP